MKKLGIGAVLAASVAVTGCATYPNQYGYNDPYNQGYYGQQRVDPRTGQVVGGAVAGGAAGAIAGAVLPGLKPGTGALAGAVLGGVLGAMVNGRQYYRDTRGYCYYVDPYGQPHYNYQVRC
jgi:hypothetical protein